MSKPIECFHGVNSNPSYYPFELCKRILVPYNLVFEKKIKIDWIQGMKEQGKEIMIDSGAARYYLNSTEGYPRGYLRAYLDFLEQLRPDWAFALDFCFEDKAFQNKDKHRENFETQSHSITEGLKRGLVLLPVVQGWDLLSYEKSARVVKGILEYQGIQKFGIGSICRASKERVEKVLRWIKPTLNLEYAHGFGQTQRTIPILRKYGLARVDTSNATGNAGRGRCYCDPFGVWFYGKNSPHKPKHNFERFFDLRKKSEKKKFYHFLFLRNHSAIEAACNGVSDDWIHEIHENRIDRYFSKEVISHA